MEKARVQKFISKSGICSRRSAEKLIEEGRVKVNGIIIKLGDQCFETDEIKIDDKIIDIQKEKNIYIVMNKKRGVVCTCSDEFGRKTVFDSLGKNYREIKLFTVGRLDKETTGLLLITNDGDFAQKIIHPSKNIEKEYFVELDRNIRQKDIESIENGLILDNYKLSKCRIKKVSEKNIFISIHEGKKRQIRRIFEKKGYMTLKLERVRIGGMKLDKLNLKEGQYLEMKKEKILSYIFS